MEKYHCLKVTRNDVETISYVWIRDHEVSDSVTVYSLNKIWKGKVLKTWYHSTRGNKGGIRNGLFCFCANIGKVELA